MSETDTDQRKERARARAAWPVHRYRLGEEPCEDLSATTTAAERLGMMWFLALSSWTMAGRSIPDYPRAAIPGRIRREQPPLDDDE